MIGTRLARRLRPIARERARLMKMKPGQQMFYGDMLYGKVTVVKRGDMKPYPHHFFRANRSGVDFFRSALPANVDQFSYTMWSILFDMRPKRRIRLENRIRNKERKKAQREIRNNGH